MILVLRKNVNLVRGKSDFGGIVQGRRRTRNTVLRRDSEEITGLYEI